MMSIGSGSRLGSRGLYEPEAKAPGSPKFEPRLGRLEGYEPRLRFRLKAQPVSLVSLYIKNACNLIF
jgi:hypothetical protein